MINSIINVFFIVGITLYQEVLKSICKKVFLQINLDIKKICGFNPYIFFI